MKHVSCIVCLILAIWCVSLVALFGQRKGLISNSGFEASFSTTFSMPDWRPWGNGSTPDIQPGQWSVDLRPIQGNTYLGLINREDGTREAVLQHLQTPLEAGKCYYFTIALARDADYAGFGLPLSLQVKGLSDVNRKGIALARSPLIDHQTWRIYTLEFTSDLPITDLILEAAPGPGVLMHYRGNLLVDALSGISACIRASL
ncbi:MAG: hypothetical protein K9I85_03475 [Saprospiraceae bacterium]|nr:hypothetical protein [Saprospiraceae bacterium]